jgi:hypothetical protein
MTSRSCVQTLRRAIAEESERLEQLIERSIEVKKREVRLSRTRPVTPSRPGVDPGDSARLLSPPGPSARAQLPIPRA